MIKNFVRSVLYKILGVLSSAFEVFVKPRVVVYCYHSFDSTDWEHNVLPENFKSQILFLKEKFGFISPDEFCNYLDNKLTLSQTKILLTIDDGYSSVMQVKNFLQDHEIKPILLVLGDSKSGYKPSLGPNKEFLSDTDIKTLIKDGWEIGCHSLTHADFNKLTNVVSETSDAKKIIEDTFSIKLRFFSYPLGVLNVDIKKAVKEAGFKCAFSMSDSIFINDLYDISRVGVVNSHSMSEFKYLHSVLVVIFRKLVKFFI